VAIAVVGPDDASVLPICFTQNPKLEHVLRVFEVRCSD
jgi:hypothetical protein